MAIPGGNTTTRYKKYISDFQSWQKQVQKNDPAYANWLANENAQIGRAHV